MACNNNRVFLREQKWYYCYEQEQHQIMVSSTHITGPSHPINKHKQPMQSTLNILIVGRIIEYQQIMGHTITVVSKFSSLHPATFYFMDQATTEAIKQSVTSKQPNFIQFNRTVHAQIIDYVVTIGGDGTILYASKEFQELSPPFLTFHHGTLGFLCKFRVDQLDSVIQKAVMAKLTPTKEVPFEVNKLMRIKVSINTRKSNELITRERHVLLNEVAITRRNASLIKLEITVNNEYITTTGGDGILVSTPTGSTAYALSAGGPVVLNGVNSIILVPLAPNSLSFRPICLPSTSVIKIKVILQISELNKESKQTCFASFDGQSITQIGFNDEIEIKYEDGHDTIIYESKQTESKSEMPTWMQRLKNYLGWNEVFKSPTCSIMSKRVEKIEISECTEHKKKGFD